MSLLDQAFIRVYSPRERQAAPRRRSEVDAERVAAVAHPSGVETARDGLDSVPPAPPAPAAASRPNLALITQFVETSAPVPGAWSVDTESSEMLLSTRVPAATATPVEPEPDLAAEVSSAATAADAQAATGVEQESIDESAAPADDFERISIPVSEAAAEMAGPHWRRGLGTGVASAEAAHRDTADPGLEPGLEVEQFVLSPICQRLLQEHGDVLRRQAELLAARAAAGDRVIAIVGSRRSEGRTTLMACLAKLLAELQLRVAVMDSDFQRPCLGATLGVNVQAGIEQVLQGECALADVLISSLRDRFTLAPLRPQSGPASRLAMVLRGAALFRELRQQYGLVLLDAGPCEPTGEGDGVAHWLKAIHVDAAEVTFNARSGGQEQLAFACRTLADAGIPLLGCIETFSMHQRPALRILAAS